MNSSGGLPDRSVSSRRTTGCIGVQAQNDYLLHWETTVADTRIHGTIRKQVQQIFRERERQALGTLPLERFPSFQEAQRKVSRDSHVAVDKSYYSVPLEYLGYPLCGFVGIRVWCVCSTSRWKPSAFTPLSLRRCDFVAVEYHHIGDCLPTRCEVKLWGGVAECTKL